MSQYLVLLYDDEDAWVNADEETVNRIRSGHRAFQEKNEKAIAGGNALQPTTTATTVRADGAGGFTVTDGPFVETKEALGGYYLVEAADLDKAIEMARQIPVVSAGRAGVEIRPIQVLS